VIGENLTMFAVYAYKANPDNPLAALAIGDLPEPEVPEGE
jgi:hypothetical protein